MDAKRRGGAVLVKTPCKLQGKEVVSGGREIGWGTTRSWRDCLKGDAVKAYRRAGIRGRKHRAAGGKRKHPFGKAQATQQV